VHLGAKAKGLAKGGKGLIIETAEGKEETLPADKILVTVGRKPLTEGWGREELVLDMEGRAIKIDEHCRTSMRGIYAIGDVTGEPMLAHRGMAQGEMVAEIIAGENRRWNKAAISAICFTDPEIVSTGLSPDEAKAAGFEIKTALFPFSANGRAMTMEGEDGFVRVTARADNHVILGVQAVGRGVAELSAAFGLALEMGARLEDIAGTIHAHPTQSEAFHEANLRTLGHALHI
jgi:dihydrolipoamide dehydrogenase